MKVEDVSHQKNPKKQMVHAFPVYTQSEDRECTESQTTGFNKGKEICETHNHQALPANISSDKDYNESYNLHHLCSSTSLYRLIHNHNDVRCIYGYGGHGAYNAHTPCSTPPTTNLICNNDNLYSNHVSQTGQQLTPATTGNEGFRFVVPYAAAAPEHETVTVHDTRTTCEDTTGIHNKTTRKRKRPNTYNVISLTSNNSDAVSSFYTDIGDCDWRYEHCGAAFWYNERLKRSTQQRVRYSRCCGEGKVHLQEEVDPPESIKQLLKDKHFLDNIRAYNQMFSMTSFGAQIDASINDSRGPYVFKISGQIHHWIGTLCPPDNEDPRFLQLYIYDTKNEVENRLQPFGGTNSGTLKPEIVQRLIQILDTHNELVRLFRTTRDTCNEQHVPEFKIHLFNVDGAHQYELPTADILGAIVFENGPNTQTEYDVIIHKKGEGPKRINKLHSTYMSLQFPLLFIYGQPGYSTKLKLRTRNPKGEQPKMTMNSYYTYQLHERPHLYGLIFKGGKLFQQYVVSVYCALEQERLDFIRSKQNNIRSEYLSGIYDAISKGDRCGADIGKRIILPSSFTGGPRYMYSHYLDALAICRVLGNPQFFITFTCNVNWPEIRRYMRRYPELSSTDRADIVDRVFEQKVQDFVKTLKEGTIFGHVTGVLYTIEFQKRGLPHCHTLLWLQSADKIHSPEDVDKFICAELPDRTTDPDGYKVVSEMMLHGPCGPANPKAPCMREGPCSKNFPKNYNDQTFFDKNGHVHYRRRKTPAYATRGKIRLDNSYVVPYNRLLCLMFHAHINVEYCGWSMLIKYLFKYISKGSDRIAARITRPLGQPSTSTNQRAIQIDEIKNFIDGRFICPHEACWRILNFPIHHRELAVQILAVHLEGMQRISFRDKEPLGYVISDDGRTMTTLTEWFTFNSLYEEGRHLTYLEFPSAFVWYEDSKTWAARKKKTKSLVGRLAYVHPAAGELFYFRMLLCHQKGCKSFNEVQKVNNILYPTFRAACQAMGLLKDDREWDMALQEAAISATASELRSLFAYILLYYDVADTLTLWEKHWTTMIDDIPARASNMSHVKDLHINDPEMKGYLLYELEMILNNCSKSLTDFGLEFPPKKLLDDLENRLLMEEKNYKRDELEQQVVIAVQKLNAEQQYIYNLIVESSARNKQELVFVYGHGGTGKTFLWKTIINKLRSEGKIVLAVASSGIASLLLPSGRTAHSRFKLPLELTDESMCHVKKRTTLANLLSETDLIVWDEAPMNDRRCFEALD